MTTFGESLRTLRKLSHDPQRPGRPLSQARLGELIGHAMGDRGVTGAAVSDWERGESKISAEDRNLLIALIKVLYKCGGSRSQQDANELLEAGNYRALNMEETQAIFGAVPAGLSAEQPQPDQISSKPLLSLLLERLLSISDTELQSLLDNAKQGPPPSWPRVLAAFMRKASERISLSPKTVLWIGVWWLAWWLVAPSLQWPFADRNAASIAIGMYAAGTLIIPLLIGLLVDTKNNEYWRQLGLIKSRLLRLYTYQGAGIGFNLGYFFVFPVVLIRHYLGFGSSVWPELAAVTLGLILGNMSARVVAHNLWLAYGRLHLADGAIFFIVAFLGPLWGMFFLEYYSVLLTPFWGSMIILIALLLFVTITVQQSKKRSIQNKHNLK